jgi:predicted aspartyl protease
MNALIDTGASCTCVDPAIIQALRLSPTGSTMVLTASTGAQAHVTEQYDVSIQIYSAMDEPPLEIPMIAVIASDLRAQGIDALIGRDVLSHCLLVYNGDMELFTLAF